MVKKAPSEIDQRKEIMDLQAKHDLEKHDCTMIELKYRRDNEQRHHEHEQERARIKSAEIRKSQMRRQNGDAFKY